MAFNSSTLCFNSCISAVFSFSLWFRQRIRRQLHAVKFERRDALAIAAGVKRAFKILRHRADMRRAGVRFPFVIPFLHRDGSELVQNCLAVHRLEVFLGIPVGSAAPGGATGQEMHSGGDVSRLSIAVAKPTPPVARTRNWLAVVEEKVEVAGIGPNKGAVVFGLGEGAGCKGRVAAGDVVAAAAHRRTIDRAGDVVYAAAHRRINIAGGVCGTAAHCRVEVAGDVEFAADYTVASSPLAVLPSPPPIVPKAAVTLFAFAVPSGE